MDGLLGLSFGVLSTVRPKPQHTFWENVLPDLSHPVFTADLEETDGTGTYEFGMRPQLCVPLSITDHPQATSTPTSTLARSTTFLSTPPLVTGNSSCQATRLATRYVLTPQRGWLLYPRKVHCTTTSLYLNLLGKGTDIALLNRSTNAATAAQSSQTPVPRSSTLMALSSKPTTSKSRQSNMTSCTMRGSTTAVRRFPTSVSTSVVTWPLSRVPT